MSTVRTRLSIGVSEQRHRSSNTDCGRAGAECERVFRDATDDQVSAKRYSFFASSRLAVTGRVDEYEPESVWLRVEGDRGVGEVLRRVAADSEFAAHRLLVSLPE